MELPRPYIGSSGGIHTGSSYGHHLLAEEHCILGLNRWTSHLPGHGVTDNQLIYIADLYMSWSAAGFVLGESGRSIREIIAVTGADVSSKQGLWKATSAPARWFQISSLYPSQVCHAVQIMTAAMELFNDFVDRKRRFVCISSTEFSAVAGGIKFTFRPPSKAGVCAPFSPSCFLPTRHHEIISRSPVNRWTSGGVDPLYAASNQSQRHVRETVNIDLLVDKVGSWTIREETCAERTHLEASEGTSQSDLHLRPCSMFSMGRSNNGPSSSGIKLPTDFWQPNSPKKMESRKDNCAVAVTPEKKIQGSGEQGELEAWRQWKMKTPLRMDASVEIELLASAASRRDDHRLSDHRHPPSRPSSYDTAHDN